MVREFLIIMDSARTDSDFSVSGSTNNGRLDIACRFINSTLFNSYSLRTDVNSHILLRGPPNPPVHMKFVGKRINGLHPGENAIAGYIKKNLGSFERRKVSANMGVQMDRRGLEEVLNDSDNVPVVLHEEGEDIADSEIPENSLFIIGDHRGLSEEDTGLVESHGGKKVSLGETPYQAQQISSFLNIYMDRLTMNQ